MTESEITQVQQQLKQAGVTIDQVEQQAIAKGKARVLKLESIRTQKVTMTDILSARPDVLEWWMKIET